MELKWSHHFGRQFRCRSAGPYIGRRRRLKGMEEGRKREAWYYPHNGGLSSADGATVACLPHICRGTVPNFEMGPRSLKHNDAVKNQPYTEIHKMERSRLREI